MRLPTVVVRGDVLTSWLTVSDLTRSRLAAELGVSKGRVSQLLTSREEPSAHLIAKLMILTNLPFDRLFKLVRELHGATSLSHSTAAERGVEPSGSWPSGQSRQAVVRHRKPSVMKGA